MPELHPAQREHTSFGVVSPMRRIGHTLRAFVSDVREGWRNPTIPTALPTLSDYPVRRP